MAWAEAMEGNSRRTDVPVLNAAEFPDFTKLESYASPNTERGKDENLNAPGMHFVPLAEAVVFAMLLVPNALLARLFLGQRTGRQLIAGSAVAMAGIALLVFGSGPIKGFAVVHCLGILTSMFSAVFFSRGLVNLWYGRQKKLKSVSIGQVWKPQASAPASPGSVE